jgi:rhodanese-related sulfurtransferase
VDFILHNWILIVAALASGGMLLRLYLAESGSGLSPADAVQLMNREKGVLIDVREPAEFAAGHPGGAKNVPLAQLDALLPQTVKNKAFPLIFTCATGRRASQAVSKAKALGYEKSQVLAGGLKGWQAASLPVVK